MGYSAVIVGVSAFLVLIYGIGEVGSLNFSFFRQPFFILQCSLLSVFIIAVLWRKLKAIGLLGGNFRYRFFLFFLIFFLSSAVITLVNKVWIVRTFERDAWVSAKSIRSPLGEKERAKHPPICTVEFASGVDVGRTAIGLLDCEVWHRLDPGSGYVHVRTDIGVTGLEFSKILNVNTTKHQINAPVNPLPVVQ